MTLFDLIYILITLLGTVYIALWRFKQYRIDKFRQNVFALRDELFDYAVDGNIEFSHPAYTTLRSLMNGYIRFSHRISLLQILLILLTESMFDDEYKPKPFEQVWKEAIVDLDDERIKTLQLFQDRASAHLFYYIFLSSIVKKLIVIPLIFTLVVKDLFSHRKEIFSAWKKSRTNNLEVQSYEISKQHSEQIGVSIEHLNTDAFAFGKAKASVLIG